jgi:hypothetical protein
MIRHAALVAAAGAAAAAAAPGVPSPTPLPPGTLQWRPLGEPGCGGDITAVRVNPYNRSQVYVAGDMLGVGVSLDGGATWSAPRADAFASWEMADFSFDPVLQRVYVASLSGPYYAEYAVDPLNWTSIRAGFPAPGYGAHWGTTQRVLVDPSSAGRRLLAFGGNKRGWDGLDGLGIVWESTDAGASWVNTSVLSRAPAAGGSGGNVVGAEWGGAGGAVVWAAASGAGVFRSTDAGRTWAAVAGSGLPAAFSFASLAAHPTDAAVAWVGMADGSGVWKTADGGATWAPANTGLETGGSFESLAVAPSDGDRLYAGNGNEQGKLWVSTDGGGSWAPSGPPPAAQAYGLGLAASFLSVDPADADVVYQATWVTLWRSVNAGANWSDLTAFQPANATAAGGPPGTVWRGTGFSGLVTTNIKFNEYARLGGGGGGGGGGSTWAQPFLAGMDAGKIWSAVDPSLYGWRRQSGLNLFGGGNDFAFGADGATVYAATGQDGWPSTYSTEGVTVSRDGGVTFAYGCGHPNTTGSGASVVARAVHTVPANTSALWAVFQDGRAYFSGDGCGSWALQAALNDTVYGLVALPTADADPAATTLFAPGDKGVWVTGPGWTTGAASNWTLLPGGPTAWTYSTSWCTLSRAQPDALVCANAWWDTWHSFLWVLNMTQARANLAAGGSGPTGWRQAYQPPGAAFSTLYRWSDTADGVQAFASNENPYPEASPATGVWVSVDGGGSWSQQNAGLRMRRVSALAFTPDGARLIAGLNGGGFYVADAGPLRAARAAWLAAGGAA